MAKGLNSVHLIGNLGKDPELKYTTACTPVCQISLATSEKFKNNAGEVKEHTEWHRVIFWNKLAEIAGEYLKKGAQIYVSGKLQTRSWDKDGVTHYSTEIIAREMLMLGSAPGKGNEKRAAAAAGAGEISDGTQITDEDIPF